MLTEMKIENIALVDNVKLNFEPGLSVLTGETGAGKSVIVTAVALALGERADREFVRHGSDSASVTATFRLRGNRSRANNRSSEKNSSRVVNVQRLILTDGTSRVKIDGKQSSLSRLREVVQPVAEILGQHANQMLMDEDNHLLFLDRFASLEESREEVTRFFSKWQKVSTELTGIMDKRDRLLRERQLLLFQKDEIEKSHLQVGEEEQLLEERKILDSARTLMASSDMIQQVLDADDVSVIQLLGLVKKELERMGDIDNSLQKQLDILVEMEIQVEEMRRFLQQYGSSIIDDPQRIEDINLRLDLIYNLKKKYGGSEKAVLETLRSINKKLADRPDIDSYIDNLRKENDRSYKQYSTAAIQLSRARQKAARHLCQLVIKELSELAIDSCDFKIELLYEPDPDGIVIDDRAVKPYPHGLEKGRFLFSANPGAPLKSLIKTASGGEISRVLLALKSAERKHRRISHSLLVFDEVDAGIGGQTAVEVGRKLKKLSLDCQVIVITHLHQIARQADHHFVAEKYSDQNNQTFISVRKLGEKDIVAELDRMVALPEN